MAKSPGRPSSRSSSRKSPTFNRPVKDYAPSPLEDKEPAPNFDLLSDETKVKLREQARVKVDADDIHRAEIAFLAAEEDRLERELHPEAYEESREIEIDVAIYPPVIVLDGKYFWHGRKYTVKQRVFDTIRDLMFKARRHYNDTQRNPMQVMQESAQAIAKGGPSYATINSATGQVTKF